MRTDAAREVIGTARLEQIVVALAKGMTHFHVTALQAGYSGAAILKAKAAKSANFSAASNLVIKVSSSKNALHDELNRLPVVGSTYDVASVVPINHEIIERDGLYAIAMREVCEMTLLRNFLGTRGLTNSDKEILNRVVRDLLIAPAKEAEVWESFGLQKVGFTLRAAAGSEIDDFLSGSAELTELLTVPDRRAIKATQEFIGSVLKSVWSFTIHGRLAARLHGDFHCRNVFIKQGERPILIDFGRSEFYPRLFDFAALDADLVLSVFDSGKGKDYILSNVNDWFRDVTNAFPYSNAGKNSKATTKAGWLRQRLLLEMVNKLPSVLPAEYAETLVFQYLRYLRFPNIAIAKKILAARLIEQLTKKFGLRKTSLA